MERAREQHKIDRRGWLAASVIACALVLGGGGTPNPATEIALQLIFAAAALAWIWWLPRAPGAYASRTLPREVWWIAAIVLVVPFIQLVPLPPAIWHELPGRARIVAGLALIDAESGWRPISISPPRTLASLLAMIPPVLAMLTVASLGWRERRLVLATVALAALAGALLGGLQMVGAEGAFRLYERSTPGWLTAFHANRNAAADTLLIGSLALTACFALRRGVERSRWTVLFSAQAVLIVAVLLTGSRAGITLLPLVLLLQLPVLGRSVLPQQARTAWIAVVGLFALLATLPLLVRANARLAEVFARFDTLSDSRPDLWTDTWVALAAFWPVGSGIGTFVPAFLPFERLETVDSSMPNRAHNDYLEFVLEAGAAAPAILLAVVVLLALLARRAWRNLPRERAATLFAVGTLLVIGVHSLTDYPLRNMALACLAGVAAGLLASPRTMNGSGGEVDEGEKRLPQSGKP